MISRPTILLGLSLACAFMAASCDNRKDYFIDVNKTPSLTVLKDGVEVTGGTLTDSVKIGSPYALQYYIQDEETLALNDTQIQGDNGVSIGESTVTFSGVTEGLGRVTLWARDAFGAQSTFSLNFTVFRNLPPVLRMTVNIVAIASPYEVEADASLSFDRDARFGGQIVLYEYTFGNYTFTSTLSKVRYIFGSSGQKKVSVRVKDNSGDWSPLGSQYITL
jgi:hypothetical protein